MSTQAYYKDRLGFDPKEALYDGPPQEKYRKTNSSSKQPHGYEENLTKFKGTIWDLFIETKGTVMGFNIIIIDCCFAWFFFSSMQCVLMVGINQ